MECHCRSFMNCATAVIKGCLLLSWAKLCNARLLPVAERMDLGGEATCFSMPGLVDISPSQTDHRPETLTA